MSKLLTYVIRTSGGHAVSTIDVPLCTLVSYKHARYPVDTGNYEFVLEYPRAIDCVLCIAHPYVVHSVRSPRDQEVT